MAPAPRVHEGLVDTVCRGLASAGDPQRAAGQQAYMKSAMPFHGLTSPALAALLRPVLADPAYRLDRREGWEATVRALWDRATHREQRYAALALLGHRAYRGWRDSDTMPLYRYLIVTGAWWDLVDDIATHRVREVLLAHHDVEAPRLRGWAHEEDLWLRRAAIIGQVGARDRTDPDLLVDVIEPNLGDPDFFIRKAIGWALREYGRTEPDWVRGFVAGHGARLSPLSRREALKWLT